jgi:hypothetical protein
MSFLASRKFSWLVCLILAGFILAPVWADDEDEEEEEEEVTWYTGTGSGSTAELALDKAMKDALMKCVREVGPKDIRRDLENVTRAKKINDFITTKGKEYVTDKKIKKKYNPETRKIIARFAFDEDALRRELTFILKEAENTLKGLRVVIASAKLPDGEKDVNYREEDEAVDRGVMFDYFQNRLQMDGIEVYDVKQLEAIRKTEAKVFDQSASQNPGEWEMSKFLEYDLFITMWVVTKKVKDEAIGPAWGATIGVKAVRPQTAREYARFQVSSLRVNDPNTYSANLCPLTDAGDRVARQDAIKSVAEATGKQLLKLFRSNPLPMQNEVIFRFKGFNTSQIDKVKTGMLRLAAGKKSVCEIQPGGRGSGPGSLEYHVKWNRNSCSQEAIKAWVRETCEEEGVNIRDDQYTQGVQWFTPGESE